MKEVASFEGVHCANCQTPLEGEYCHHCGQSVHSVLRPVHGLFEEFVETFLHIDGRILHTLPPLFLKPGFLTLEYFSGRRVRYIAPFRLMFVLCLLSFFALHLATDIIAQRAMQRHHSVVLVNRGFAQAKTPGEVNDALSKNLQALEAARAASNAAMAPDVDLAEQQLREQANERLVELGASPARSSSAAIPTSTANGVPTEAARRPRHPVRISWLPDFANERLTTFVRHIDENFWVMGHGDSDQRRDAIERFQTGMFGALPGTMLVLIPVFALLLKIFYIFKRRLYMEHIIVSLHSHAFLFLNLLLVVITGMVSTWLKPHAAWAGHAVGMLQVPLMIWMPVYLLIMQKRIYRQGWVLTFVKFWCIGWCYVWLSVFTLTTAAVLGFAH